MQPKPFLYFFSLYTALLGLTVLAFNSLCLQHKLNLPPRYAQALVLEATAPKTLVLGSSRQEHIPTDSLAWPEPLRPVCSIRSPMETIGRMQRHLLHALAFSPLEELWVGLDFFTFNTYNQGPPDPPFFLQSPLPAEAKKRWLALHLFRIQRALTQVLCIRYFQANCLTVYQECKRYLGISSQAFTEAYAEDNEQLERKLRGMESFTLNEGFFISPPKQFTFEPREGLAPKLEHMQALLRLCYKESIPLKLIINPFHARFFELIQAAGLWPWYQEWLKSLATLVESEAQAAGQAPYPIFDFSGYNAYNTEAFDPKASAMGQWYIESSHFNKKLGERMIQRIYQPEGKALAEEGFGKRLHAPLIQDHIIELERGRERYYQTHPEDIAAIRSLYQEWKQANHALGIRKSYEAHSTYYEAHSAY